MSYRIKVKELIEDTDTRQKALAAALNMSQSTFSNYVTGRTAMPAEVLADVAKYFHVTTDYLLGLTDEPYPPYPVSESERELLEHFRSLERDQKELIYQSIELMRRQNREKE